MIPPTATIKHRISRSFDYDRIAWVWTLEAMMLDNSAHHMVTWMEPHTLDEAKAKLMTDFGIDSPVNILCPSDDDVAVSSAIQTWVAYS